MPDHCSPIGDKSHVCIRAARPKSKDRHGFAIHALVTLEVLEWIIAECDRTGRCRSWVISEMLERLKAQGEGL